jgi:hypothetical protein
MRDILTIERSESPVMLSPSESVAGDDHCSAASSAHGGMYYVAVGIIGGIPDGRQFRRDAMYVLVLDL